MIDITNMPNAEVVVFIEGTGKEGIRTDPTGLPTCPICGALGGSWCSISYGVDLNCRIGYIHKKRLEAQEIIEREAQMDLLESGADQDG